MIFTQVWIPSTVEEEFNEGQRKGYNVPNLSDYSWIEIKNPQKMPSEWLSLDLGPGELAAMALSLENKEHILLLDDMLARKTSKAAGLMVWGTLKIILEAKNQNIIKLIEPYIDLLCQNGMWISEEIRLRIIKLAQEDI